MRRPGDRLLESNRAARSAVATSVISTSTAPRKARLSDRCTSTLMAARAMWNFAFPQSSSTASTSNWTTVGVPKVTVPSAHNT